MIDNNEPIKMDTSNFLTRSKISNPHQGIEHDFKPIDPNDYDEVVDAAGYVQRVRKDAAPSPQPAEAEGAKACPSCFQKFNNNRLMLLYNKYSISLTVRTASRNGNSVLPILGICNCPSRSVHSGYLQLSIMDSCLTARNLTRILR